MLGSDGNIGLLPGISLDGSVPQLSTMVNFVRCFVIFCTLIYSLCLDFCLYVSDFWTDSFIRTEFIFGAVFVRKPLYRVNVSSLKLSNCMTEITGSINDILRFIHSECQ